MSSEIISFLIVDEEVEHQYLELLKRAPAFYTYGNGIVIKRPEQLIKILRGFRDNFKFRVLIHAGINNESQNFSNLHIQTIKDEIGSDNLQLITRHKELFPGNSAFGKYNGQEIFDAHKLGSDKNIDQLKVITKTNNKYINYNKPKNDFKSNYNQEEDITISVLTALEEEAQKFKNNMNGDNSSNGFIGKFKKISDTDYDSEFRVLVQNQMGMVDSSLYTYGICRDTSPNSIILAGVCGGLENEVNIYDIIIPKITVDIITGKYESHNFTEPYGYTAQINPNFYDFIRSIVSKESFISNEMYSLIPSSDKYKRERDICSNLTIHCESLATGPFVLKTQGLLKEISQQMNSKIVGFEMEGYGFARVFELFDNINSKPLIIKSVMDYTSENKNDFAENGENIKSMAAYMSYICTRALMPHIPKFFK